MPRKLCSLSAAKRRRKSAPTTTFRRCILPATSLSAMSSGTQLGGHPAQSEAISGGESFQPSVTLAVCTRNRPRHLNRCLEQLSQLGYPHFEVLVVENAPLDEKTRQVASSWRVCYEVEPEAGLSRARNRAASLARTELIAYLDDDALPEPSWVRDLAAPFRDPEVMAVAGRVIPCGDTELERAAANVRGTSSRGTVGNDELRIFSRHTESWFILAGFGAVGIGANMAFRRSAFTFWPGFDERLGSGGVLYAAEEYHAFLELIRRGKRVVYTPHAVVRHPYAPGAGEDLRRRYLSSCRGVGAYLAYLLAEYPEHTVETLGYAARRLLGGPSVRNDAKVVRPEGVTAWSTAWALCSGPVVYWREGRKAPAFRERPPLLAS